MSGEYSPLIFYVLYYGILFARSTDFHRRGGYNPRCLLYRRLLPIYLFLGLYLLILWQIGSLLILLIYGIYWGFGLLSIVIEGDLYRPAPQREDAAASWITTETPDRIYVLKNDKHINH